MLFRSDIFSKKTYRWPTDTWKCAQHHSSSGKCNSKPQWYVNSHLLEWLLSERQEIKSAEVVEKRELIHYWWEYKWVQPMWKTVWRFLKKLKIEGPHDKIIPFLDIYPMEIKTGSQRYIWLHSHFHGSIIHNSQAMETT